MENSEVVFSKLRRQSQTEAANKNKLTKEMLKDGTIIPTFSPYNSPVILVKKKKMDQPDSASIIGRAWFTHTPLFFGGNYSSILKPANIHSLTQLRVSTNFIMLIISQSWTCKQLTGQFQ